ncbi:hypothetical protein QF031_002960 [Pseudarthrobacter defluvii]|nr:hypothetical protein [Pseudarthrobacter defluvii]
MMLSTPQDPGDPRDQHIGLMDAIRKINPDLVDPVRA